MNRRSAIASVLGLVGAGAVLKEVPAKPKPLCFIMELPDECSEQIIPAIQRQWERSWAGTEVPRLLIAPESFKLRAIGPDAKEYVDLSEETA